MMRRKQHQEDDACVRALVRGIIESGERKVKWGMKGGSGQERREGGTEGGKKRLQV